MYHHHFLFKTFIESSYILFSRSGDEDVDLIPVEEFYLKAPSDISKPVSLKLSTLFYYLIISILFFLLVITANVITTSRLF